MKSSVALACSAAIQVWASHDGPLVEIPFGQVRGVWSTKNGGMRVFRGIPYAKPPVGDNRWRPPTAHSGWAGVLDASDFGPSCVQPSCWVSENVSRLSEDCLTINVLAPKLAKKSAVVVYFHAGEFHCGSSNDAESNWPQLVKDDIVFVSFNYRVGVFGYLGADELRTRDPRGGTGNYGMLDQRFAIKWVKDNIAAFGGDPSRITIAGESSGGTSVAYHLLTGGGAPTNQFARAILQSPGLTQVKSMPDATENFEWTLAALRSFNSPSCARAPGYAGFKSVMLNTIANDTVLRTSFTDTFADAEEWCDHNPECLGFTQNFDKHSTIYVNNANFYVFDLEAFVGAQATVTYIKKGPSDKQQRMDCLLNADAFLLNSLTLAMPRDDTFQTDAWGPVVDGVDLKDSLMNLLNKGDIPQGVDIMVGSNLDEGTEFMALTPPLECNATASDFKKWAETFYGSALGSAVPMMYPAEELQRPLPACGLGGNDTGDLTGEEAQYFNAAMRTAGDAAIRCPSLRLAENAPGAAFVYYFTMTPKLSVNFPNTSNFGAFHGAEVPFVFGDDFELQPGAERKLSKAMGCLWSSFAQTGNPSNGACGSNSWPTWTPYENNADGSGKNFLELGSELKMRPLLDMVQRRCDFFLGGRGVANISVYV